MKERRQLSLDEDVERILAAQDNASGYVSDLVRDADRTWREALVLLRARRWSDGALCAACDVLQGWMWGQPPEWVAQSMRDDQRSNNVCGKWGVDPLAWDAHVAAVAERADEALALVRFGREFWRNPLAERAIRGVER